MVIHRPSAYSSPVRWWVVAVLVACGGGGSNQRCEIFSDCPAGQVCISNVCTERTDGGTDEDGSIPDNCGDGMLDPGEECDQGSDNANAPDSCRLDCTFPRCGDAIVDRDEGCDDGNATSFDGCTPQCESESRECVVVHGGNDRGSSISVVPVSAMGNAQSVNLREAHSAVAEHSIVRCGDGLFVGTDEGIVSIALRDGAPVPTGIETSENVHELVCAGDTLFAVNSIDLMVLRYTVVETNLTFVDALPIPSEMRAGLRHAPFVRGDTLWLIAISDRGLGNAAPRVVEVDLGTFSVTSSFVLEGAARGQAVDVSEDGRLLFATNGTGCPARWELTEGSIPSSACEGTAVSADTVLAVTEGLWLGSGDGATLLDPSSWDSLRREPGFATTLLVATSSSVVALNPTSATLLSEAPMSINLLSAGTLRGATVVPCP